MFEPPTEPREPVDYCDLRERVFEHLMMDAGTVESIVWDHLLEWSDYHLSRYFKDIDERGRDE